MERVLASLEQRRSAGGRARASEGGELEALEARHLSARASASDEEEYETDTGSDEEASEESSGPASRCAPPCGCGARRVR